MVELRVLLVCLASSVLIAASARAQPQRPGFDGAEVSVGRGVAASAILGSDPRGIPIVCGTELVSRATPPAGRAVLPAGTIGWETIPGVIRADGSETFRLEVAVDAAGAVVTLDSVPLDIVPPVQSPVTLRDDGIAPDRIQGDGIATAGPFSFDPTKHFFPSNYLFDPESPADIDMADIGIVRIAVPGDAPREFLLPPKVGLLGAGVAAAPALVLSEDVVVTSNLVNVRSNERETQRFMRHLLFGPSGLSRSLYAVLPDVFDFLIFFSTHKIEKLPSSDAANFVAGIHTWVKTGYTGTGLGDFDLSSEYGSGGRLQGVNALDAYDRGVTSKTFFHELVHQWACFLDPDLGICDGAHYNPRSSAGSLVGGFAWAENGDGSYTALCEEGRNGAHRAAAIDLYLAGLLEPADLDPVRAYADALSVIDKCGGESIEPAEIVATVAVEDIQSRHGERLPGPAIAQQDFHLGFVVESVDRLLTPTELTFYEVLAAHATKPLVEGASDPYAGFNWVSIGRFFAPDVRWTSEVCLLDGDDDGVCDASQCERGDCNGNGSVDAGDSICTVRCLLGDPAPGFDCDCASDCNCASGLEAADPICAVQRLIGSFPAEGCGNVP